MTRRDVSPISILLYSIEPSLGTLWLCNIHNIAFVGFAISNYKSNILRLILRIEPSHANREYVWPITNVASTVND